MGEGFGVRRRHFGFIAALSFDMPTPTAKAIRASHKYSKVASTS
jgi:hypothetical protein